MKTRIKTRLYNLSLKYKIMLISLIVAIIPLFAFMLIAVNLYNKNIEERSSWQNRENLNVLVNRIDGLFKSMEICSNYLTINLNQVITDHRQYEAKKEGRINSQLSTSKLLFEEVDSIVFIDANGKLYTTDCLFMGQEQKIVSSSLMARLTKTTGATILFDFEEDSPFIKPDYPIISFGKKVIEIRTGKTLGYLFINLKGDELTASINSSLGQYIILDTKHHYLEGLNDESLLHKLKLQEHLLEGKANYSVRTREGRYMISSITSSYTDWQIVYVCNMALYHVDGNKLILIWIWIGIILAVLLIFVAIILTQIVTRPLTNLRDSAELIASGDMSIRVNARTGDEIGRLGHIFNEMMEKIVALIKKVDEEGKKKREYELALIQEQVKPHFLYNTLDIIIMLSEMNKNREAQRVTRKLADYYKNSLSDSAEVVTIEREIRIIEDYLELQMIRYEDKFDYEIHIENEIRQLAIPKMTLQPVVENAIYHGLKCKEGYGHIIISSKIQPDCVEIIIEDDGIGMKEETLKDISSMKDKPQKHFGVYSVDHRLKLFYGETYGILVSSKYHVGTKVTIRLPKAEENRVWKIND